MKTITDLVEVIKANDGNGKYEIKAITPDGNIINVGVQHYVENDVYFMFAAKKGKASETQTITGLKANLEYEASDECWKTSNSIFDDSSSAFLDCEVCFVNYDCDKFFDDVDYEDTEKYVFDVYGFTVEDGTFYLHCENDFVDTNNESTESIEELTDEEKEMIKKALNYYGDRLADTEGYSSGEPYWNLMNKFSV